MENLQEAYLSVYEATAMAKRGLNEPEIRQQIAKSTGGGEAADRATKLADKPTFGNDKAAQQRQRLARAQRGDFRKTTSSSPGLHGYAHQSNDPEVKAKQAARGAQRGALTPAEKQQLNREEFDLFDYLLEYLVAEGYADTNNAAIAIMANMSEEWKQEIVEYRKLAAAAVGGMMALNMMKPGIPSPQHRTPTPERERTELPSSQRSPGSIESLRKRREDLKKKNDADAARLDQEIKTGREKLVASGYRG